MQSLIILLLIEKKKGTIFAKLFVLNNLTLAL